MKQNKETIKTYFETGDKPTQQQFENLIDSYVDSKQSVGEANRRFVIDETGEVSVTSKQKTPEYTLSEITGNKLALLKDGATIKEIDLTPYIDDTNLARLISGKVDTNGIATFTRDDNSTFTVDLSNLKNTQIQSDWNQSDNSQDDFIKNKPTIPVNQNLDDVLTEGNTSAKSINIVGSKGSIAVSSNEALISKGLDSIQIHASAIAIKNKDSHIILSTTGTSVDFQNIFISAEKSGTLALESDIPTIQAGTNISIDNTNPLQPIISVTEIAPPEYDSRDSAIASLGNGKKFRYSTSNLDGAIQGTVAWT
ncbi:hypothetical protein [Tenacibaculum halocynthiae]|uniref:hypothetical protein n=1 Tax=Tenacibaculum halocynthiae TaxID=1254437 RepID=UPI003D65608D